MYTYIYAYIYGAYMLAKGIETINKQTQQQAPTITCMYVCTYIHTCNTIVG